MPTARKTPLIYAVMLLALLPQLPASAETPKIDEQLHSGQLDQAEQLLAKHLQTEPSDDLARFQLGTIKLLRAVETLAQDGVRYGATSRSMMLPFVRLGGFRDNNKNPEPVTYQDIRAMIERFQKSVAEAEATLALIEADDLYWSLDMRKVALDLDGDGQLKKSEQLASLFRLVARNTRRGQGVQPKMILGLDSADVYWLRGYCHVLQALADMVLAYDHQRLFDLTAHAFFADPQTKYAREQDARIKHSTRISNQFWGGWESIADLIAAIHLIDFPLLEPQRMANAREHLLKMVELSHKNWELVLKETDNRNELIPGPEQTSVIPGMMVDQSRIDAWHRFLQEAEAILNGDKLLPFWRSGFEGGVNLHRVFTDARDFDLILWVQGSAALPYLEDGEQTDPELWREFQRLFGGRFLGFAFWVN